MSSRREEGRFGVSRSLKREGNVERPLFKAKSSELLAYLDWDWFKWPPREAGAVSVADSLTGSFGRAVVGYVCLLDQLRRVSHFDKKRNYLVERNTEWNV